jgi:hypothetical protein
MGVKNGFVLLSAKNRIPKGWRSVGSPDVAEKKKGWIEILPRIKIQYPMKNRDKNTTSCFFMQLQRIKWG